MNGSFERARLGQNGGASTGQGHATQVKVVRVNNFVSSQDSSGKAKGRDNAQSHSPSGLHTGGAKTTLQGGKVKKGLKVINNSSKSPYLNNVFTKNGIN